MTLTTPASAADVIPMRVGGVGLNVADVERSLTFYTEAVGLRIAVRVPAQGPALEIALCVSGDVASGEPFVVLAANQGAPQPNAADFGRVILNTTDAAAVAARATHLGYAAIKVGSPEARPVYFLTDPDGYKVELYQASAAEAKY